MANECIPTKSPALTVTGQATAAVTGKRFVVVSGPRIGGGIAGGSSVVTTPQIAGYDTTTLSGDISDVYQVAPAATSGSAVLGVAGQDIPVGQVNLIYKVGQGHILPVTAGAAITAGQEVQTDAQGRAIPLAGGKAVGYAVDSAASGADAEIVLY